MRLVLVAAASAVLLLLSAPEVGASNPVLTGTITPGGLITLKDSNNQTVTSIPAGTYDFVLHDSATTHNWHLVGTSVESGTSAGQTGDFTFNDVVITPGSYRFQCDFHPTIIFGTFTVTQPGPTITPHVSPTPNAAGWNSADVQVTFQVTSSGGALTNESAACTTPTDISTETAGQDVTCEATDDNGTTTTTVTVKLDKTAPTAQIVSGPANPTTLTTATFDLSADEGVTWQCALDSPTFTSCSDPTTFSKLGKRTHTFQARATDPAGNTDTVSQRWTNGAPPTVKLSTKLKMTGPSVDVVFTSSDPGAANQCNRDDAGYQPCSSPVHLTSLASGAHTLGVFGTDGAGRNGSPAAVTWTVDATPPDTSVAKGPSNGSSPNVRFKFAATEKKSTFECRLDGAGFAPCPKKGYSGLASGMHTLDVRATDAYGNTDPTPATFSWTVA